MFRTIISLFSFATVCLISCTDSSEGGPSDSYRISGKIDNASGSLVMLEQVDFNPNGREKATVIDTARIGEDGVFEFNGRVLEPVFARVKFGRSQAVPIPLDNKQFELNGSLPGLEDLKVSGNPAASEMVDLLNRVSTEGRKLSEVNAGAQRALAAKDYETYDSLSNIFKTGRDKIIASLKSFIDTSKSEVSAFYAVQQLPFEEEIEFVKASQAKLEPGSRLSRQLQARIAAVEASAAKSLVGKQAPDIELPDPEGNMRKLSDLRGKVVLVDFWAGWCGPCRRENPNVVRVYDKYKSDGFEVFSVSLDSEKRRWTDAIKQDKLAWSNHVSDLKKFNSIAAQAYKVQGIPAAFLLDREGKIVAQNLRGNELEKKVREVLQ